MMKRLSRRDEAFTLAEMMVSVAVATTVFTAVMYAGSFISRSAIAADDYSYQTNQQLRVVDFIGRDLRRAISVTIPGGGQTLTVTIPDTYGTYDSEGNPTSATVDPTIVNGAPVYGNAAQPITVTYYVSGGSLIRQQIIPAKNQTVQWVVARNVNAFQLNFVALTTVVQYSITFAPRYYAGSNNIRPGTTVAATVAARTMRIQ
jgi:type II secretory pathway component PulJ